MFIVIIIAALALWSLIATVVEIHRDGYRRIPTDPSRASRAEVDPLLRAEFGAQYR